MQIDNNIKDIQRKPIPHNVKMAIQEFFLCSNIEDEFECFLRNFDALKECKFFIYSDTIGAELPECFSTNYDNDFAIIEMGFANKYYVIDVQTCEDIINNKESYYSLDVCVELDTQVISYLKKIFISRENINIPDNKKELFYYLSDSNVNYSSLPYLIENAKKIINSSFEECYLNLISYEIFKHFDFISYYRYGIKSVDIEESNLIINVDNTFHSMRAGKFLVEMRDFYDLEGIWKEQLK